MAELTSVRDRRRGSTRTIAVESEDPARVHRGRARARPRVARERVHGARAQGARRLRRAALRGHRRRHELGEAPRRRARADGTWRTVVDRAEVTRLGEGLDATGALGPEPIERTVEAIAAMADEARARRASRRSPPSAPPGCATAANSADVRRRRRERDAASRSRSSPARRRRGSPTSPRRPALGLAGGSLVVFDTGGGSSQFTFGRGERVDEQFSVQRRRRAASPSASGSTAPSPRRRSPRRSTAIAAELERLDGRPAPDALVGMGGAVTNLAAVKHGARDVRPGRRAGHAARPRRDRPADRALPHPRGRRAARDRRPAAEPRRGHPRRRLRRAHGARRSSVRRRWP